MGHIFLSFLFFNLILINLYGHYKKGQYYISKTDLIIYIIIFIIFGTYGGGEGDYFHYKEIVERNHSIQDVLLFTGMEKQYVLLSYYVDGNYTLWRLVLFSIQFIGFGWLLYKAKLNTYPVLLSFTSFLLVTSVYGRSFWGVIFFFLGLYLLIEKKNPLYLIAIALCYVSHTSNLVLVALLPLAFVKFKKWHILALLVVFTTLVAVFRETFTDFLGSGGFDVEEADYLNDRLQNYGNSDAKNYFGRSIGETTTIVLQDLLILSILLPLIISIFKSHNGYLYIYKPLRSVINVSIGLVFFAAVILAASVGGATLFYRVYDMAMFPVALIMPCMRDSNRISKRTYEHYIYLFVLYTEMGYVRDFYYAYANGV